MHRSEIDITTHVIESSAWLIFFTTVGYFLQFKSKLNIIDKKIESD